MKTDELVGVQQHPHQETNIDALSNVSYNNYNMAEVKPIDLKDINVMSKINAALEYGRMGFKVFPIKPNEKSPQVKGWQKVATSEPEEINALWTKFPEANIGILCGKKGGVFVIDVDVKNGAKGIGSLTLFEEHIPTNSPKVLTPSGGFHFYFKPVQGTKNKANILPGIDIRSDGGYIVAPPSTLTGGEYQWN